MKKTKINCSTSYLEYLVEEGLKKGLINEKTSH